MNIFLLNQNQIQITMPDLKIVRFILMLRNKSRSNVTCGITAAVLCSSEMAWPGGVDRCIWPPG